MSDRIENDPLILSQQVMHIALSIAAVFLVMNLATFVAYGGRAYVCVGETCAPPTTDAAAVTDLVRSYGLRARR